MFEQSGIDLGHPQPLEPAVGAHEVGDHVGRRVPEDVRGRVVLLEDSADVQDGDAVAHLDRLLDVVGDEHHRLAHLFVEPQELVLEPHARHGIDGAERLVHQDHSGSAASARRHADALALAAGELCRVPVAVDVGRQAHELEQLVDAGRHPILLPAQEPRHGRDVGGDRLVREQPDLLDHVAHVPAELHGVGVGHVVAVEEDAAGGGLDEPVDQLQRRGLAAAGRPDEHADLVARHFERELARPRPNRWGRSCRHHRDGSSARPEHQ